MIRLAAIAVVGAALSACLSVGPNAATQARCGIAAEYVAKLVSEKQGKPVVFSTEAPNTFDFLGSGWFKKATASPTPVPRPSNDLLRRLHQDNRSAVRECASVRAFLTANGVAFGRAAVEQAKTRGVFHSYIESVSLPHLSGDGSQAVIVRDEFRGTADAGGWFELLERTAGGEWRVVAFRPTLLS